MLEQLPNAPKYGQTPDDDEDFSNPDQLPKRR